ncbi:MAG: fumarylacetoacetate hydrolase family protein, partial [Candidatus Limnocylindrales bacterium]
ALEHVAGYTVVNDVSARDLQGQRPALREGEHGDGQWLRAKGADTFLPLGPLLVTPDELPDTRRPGLDVRSWRTPAAGTDAGREVLMQEGRTDDMVWDVPALIEYLSATITLEAGDVIATGTPPGVGVWRTPPVFLEPGDVVRVAIDGIGSLTDPIVDADGAAPAGSPAQVILEASAAARPGRA